METPLMVRFTTTAEQLLQRMGQLVAVPPTHPPMTPVEALSFTALTAGIEEMIGECWRAAAFGPPEWVTKHALFFAKFFDLLELVASLAILISSNTAVVATDSDTLCALVSNICTLSTSLLPYFDDTQHLWDQYKTPVVVQQRYGMRMLTHWAVNTPPPSSRVAFQAWCKLQRGMCTIFGRSLASLRRTESSELVELMSSTGQHVYIQLMMCIVSIVLDHPRLTPEVREKFTREAVGCAMELTSLITECRVAGKIKIADSLISGVCVHLLHQLLSMGNCVPKAAKQHMVAVLGIRTAFSMQMPPAVVPHYNALQPVRFSRMLQGINDTGVVTLELLQNLWRYEWMVPFPSGNRRLHQEAHGIVLNMYLMLLLVIKTQQQQQQQRQQRPVLVDPVELYNYLARTSQFKYTTTLALKQSKLRGMPVLGARGVELLPKQAGLWGGLECILRGMCRAPVRPPATSALITRIRSGVFERVPAASLVSLAVTVRKIALINSRASPCPCTGEERSSVITLCSHTLDLMTRNSDTADPALVVVAKALGYVWVDACSGLTTSCSRRSISAGMTRSGLLIPVFEALGSILLGDGGAEGKVPDREHQQAVCGAFAESEYAKIGYCGNGGCSNMSGCSEAALPTLLCAGCRRVRYCCEGCQRQAWVGGGHRDRCGKGGGGDLGPVASDGRQASGKAGGGNGRGKGKGADAVHGLR